MLARVTSCPALRDDIRIGIKSLYPDLGVINTRFRARVKELICEENQLLFHLNLSSFQDFTLEGEKEKKNKTPEPSSFLCLSYDKLSLLDTGKVPPCCWKEEMGHNFSFSLI